MVLETTRLLKRLVLHTSFMKYVLTQAVVHQSIFSSEIFCAEAQWAIFSSKQLKWAFREFFKYLHCIATANRTTIALMMPISTSSTSVDFKKCCHQQIQSNQMVLEEYFTFPKIPRKRERRWDEKNSFNLFSHEFEATYLTLTCGYSYSWIKNGIRLM